MSPDHVRLAVEAPDFVTRDRQYDRHENYYRRTWPGGLMIKVVVNYRPVPPQGTWEGEVVTAYPTDHIDPRETPIWP